MKAFFTKLIKNDNENKYYLQNPHYLLNLQL